MNKIEFDTNKFDIDSYGNLYPKIPVESECPKELLDKKLQEQREMENED
jgi:hypothetical protein